jgi:hypothetical protein
MAWPRTIKGPAQNPRRAEDAMVAVSSGPGIMAPENPTRNAVKKIVETCILFLRYLDAKKTTKNDLKSNPVMNHVSPTF